MKKKAYINSKHDKENIKQVFSRIKHPQTNGSVEVTDKTVRKNLLNDFKLKKDKFNIELPLSNFLIFNNNCVHTSTKKKSIDIKN